MATNKIPVLLTSSVIAYDTGVALTDTDERIRLALESVEQWLRIDPTLHLVLCDGSSFDFTEIVNGKFPTAKIECLHFENDQELVKKYGRGYGEGEIVSYAIENSNFISAAQCFAKCTSKLWVQNFKQCTTKWNNSILLRGVFSNVFSIFKKTKFSYIDTRFYITSCSTYKKYFEKAHLDIEKDSGFGLEQCFHKIIIDNKIKNALFSVNPIILGTGGGTGSYYKNTQKKLAKEKLKISLLKTSKDFKHLFYEA